MSKKSNRGRQQPIPSAKKHNTFTWDTLHDVYGQLAVLCGGVPNQISPLIADREAVALLDDPATVAQLASSILAHARRYSQMLMAIYAKHKDRHGPALDPNEAMTHIQLYEEYLKWEESYRVVVLPDVEAVLHAFQNTKSDVPA